MHNKILSKPGPKRAKEARLAKLKEAEEKSKKAVDSEDDKKKKKSYESDDSDNDKKKSKDKDSDGDENRKKIMSKPGPKRAKEARLAKLNQSVEEKPKEKPKPVDSDDDSNESKKKKSNDSDSDSEKATKTTKSSEEQKIMSRPGPKRAKEARLAKLNTTPKTPTVEKKAESDDEDSNDKKKSKSDSSDESEETTTKKKEPESDKNVDKEKERILSKPGPKRAKEAQLAKLNQSRSEDNSNSSNSNVSNAKKSDNKSSDEEIQEVVEKPKEAEPQKSPEKSSPKKSENSEEQRKVILSKPGPKRAKEARLQKMNQSLQNSVTETKDNNNKGLENKRTNSTDSLDAIISTPAPEEESLEMEQQLEAAITSPKQPLSNGVDSPTPVPESESNDLSGLDRIGNYISIETSKHISEITNALSLTNGGLDMKRPGYVNKQFDIKPFPSNSKNVEKIVSAFYSADKKLCFLIKLNGINKCDVVLADDVNKK